MPSIQFFTEDITFKLREKRTLRSWLQSCAEKEGFSIRVLNYVFTSDEYLLKINQDYLKHDTFTDIVTFDNSDTAEQIEGDIFISIPRVRENSRALKTTFKMELCRVLIHGLLHLTGYSDKTAAEKTAMTNKEDEYLSLLTKGST